jgi:hypothetical protein
MKMVMVLVGVAIALWGIAGDVIGAPPCDAEHVSSRGLPTMNVAAFDYIQSKLDEQTEVEFIETPLQDIVESLKTKHDLPIRIDLRAFEEAAIATDAPITTRLSDISLRSALKHLLRPLELTYVVRDEVLLVTTSADPYLYDNARVYPVCDLVSEAADDAAKDYESLAELIVGVISPSNWTDAGGPGVIKSAPAARSLVIVTSEEIHEQIEGLLATLRIARDTTGGSATED